MTPVIFRKYKKNPGKGDIVAIFPGMPANFGNVMVYEHVGQHGEGSIDWMVNETEMASPDEYANLLAELKRVGYDDLEIRLRITYKEKMRAWYAH